MKLVGKLLVGIVMMGVAAKVYAGELNDDGDWQGWYGGNQVWE
jgi:hypothetical protein